MSFPTADHGFVLGRSACPTSPANRCRSLAATDDGGRTWRSLAAPEVAGDTSNPVDDRSVVTHIRFGDARNGWAYGPGLWATHDGGESWTETALDGVVTDVAGTDGVAYALVTHCDSGPCGQGATLYRTQADAENWQPVEGVTLTPTGGRISVKDTAVWIVGASAGPGQSLLAASADGTSWATRPDLCGADSSLMAVAPVTTVDIFLLCADSPAAGSAAKRVLRSGDSGVSAEPLPAEPPSSGLAEAMAAADTEVVAVTAGSGASYLYRTGDAGQTWTTALTADVSLFELAFATATQGVVIRGRPDDAGASGTELMMTHDAGRTWAPVAFA